MNQRGFTLLEVLIATAIFALLAMATYRMLDAVMQSDQQLRTQQVQLRELSRALYVFERDLLQVRSRPVRDPLGGLLPAMQGSAGQLTELELTRAGWRNPLGQARSTLQRVRWQMRDGQLQRGYWTVLDRAPDSSLHWQPLLPDVSHFQLRWLDDEDRWLEYWPPADSQAAEALTRLPKAVELVLEHRRYGQIRRLWRLPEMPQQELLYNPEGKGELMPPAEMEPPV